MRYSIEPPISFHRIIHYEPVAALLVTLPLLEQAVLASSAGENIRWQAQCRSVEHSAQINSQWLVTASYLLLFIY